MISVTGSRGILQKTCEKVAGSSTKTPEIAGTWILKKREYLAGQIFKPKQNDLDLKFPP
jgi:hypothetical protein